MSEFVTFICPHCNSRKTIKKDLLPKNAVRAVCAACRQSFPLTQDAPPSAPPTTAEEQRFQATPPQPPPERKEHHPPPRIGAIPVRPRSDSSKTLRFEFNGTAGEYFGIWIVNTLLKIVTAGIYSAWAKVRMRRFFYGSTTLEGQTFEYLADPITLFKGWLIAVCFFILYIVASKFSPALSTAVGIVIFLAFPWLLVRSRMFNARNSSHRNIRFGFQPDYGQAYLVYVGLPILSVLSLGILFPYMLYRQKKFVIEKHLYGSTPFSFTATCKEFYVIGLKVLMAFFLVAVMFIILGIVIAGALLWFSGGLSTLSSSTDLQTTKSVITAAMMFISPLAYLMVIVYAQTTLANLCWNGTNFNGNQFISKLRTGKMSYLFITNILAILFSLGLLMPWATVRMLRYRFDTLTVTSNGSIDSIIAAADNKKAISATGEEIGDIFDLPVELGL